MRLIVLEESDRRVVAYLAAADSPDGIGIMAFIRQRPGDQAASARGFKALFKRYAAFGRAGLTVDLFHEVDANAGIWEFIKGRLRCFCFMDHAEHLIILTHGVVKKTPKADRQAVAAAVAVKNRYLAAKAAGTITRDGSDHE